MRARAAEWRATLQEPIGYIYAFNGKIAWDCSGFPALEDLLKSNWTQLATSLATAESKTPGLTSTRGPSIELWGEVPTNKSGGNGGLREIAKELKQFLKSKKPNMLSGLSANPPDWWPAQQLSWKDAGNPTKLNKEQLMIYIHTLMGELGKLGYVDAFLSNKPKLAFISGFARLYEAKVVCIRISE